MRQALINNAGDRTVVFTTPCGFQISLFAPGGDGELTIGSFFNGSRADFVNAPMKLSREGAELFAKEIMGIYEGSDNEFSMDNS